MRQIVVAAAVAVLMVVHPATAAARRGKKTVFEKDTFQTSKGELTITFVGHGTLMFEYGGAVIHVDPVSREADYSAMPKARLVLITHHHGDHLDPTAVSAIRTPDTEIVLAPACASALPDGIVMRNGDVRTVAGLRIEAVPAYNLVHKRPDGKPFHPKGEGNGYVIGFGDRRVYVAGDTEDIPEMAQLRGIDIAFLPMNLPYTMTPGMVSDAAKAFKPSVLYPYHYGSTNPADLTKLLAEESGIEVRVRDLR